MLPPVQQHLIEFSHLVRPYTSFERFECKKSRNVWLYDCIGCQSCDEWAYSSGSLSKLSLSCVALSWVCGLWRLLCLLLSSSACHGLLLPLGWDGGNNCFCLLSSYTVYLQDAWAKISWRFLASFPGTWKTKGWMVQTILTVASTSLSKCAMIVAESWLLPHSITFAATLSVLKSLFPTYFSAAVTCDMMVS